MSFLLSPTYCGVSWMTSRCLTRQLSFYLNHLQFIASASKFSLISLAISTCLFLDKSKLHIESLHLPPYQHFCSTHKARRIPQAVVRLHNLFPSYFLPPTKSIAPLACAHSSQSPYASHTLSNFRFSKRLPISPVVTMSLCQNRLNEERYVQPATGAASGALH